MIAVAGLDHRRQTKILCGLPSLVGAVDQLTARHRDAARRQQLPGELLVARDALGDGTGAVGFGRPDAALSGAVADLDEIAVVEPNERDLACLGCRDDVRGARAEAQTVALAAQLAHHGIHVERVITDGGQHQITCGLDRAASDFLLPTSHHHLVHAAVRGLAGAPETAGEARQALQFERHVLHDVRGPGAFVQPLEEAAAFVVAATVLDQSGQPGAQTLREAGQAVGRVVFQRADVDQGLQHRIVGPHIRAGDVADVEDLDVEQLGVYRRIHGRGDPGAMACQRIGRRPR